MDLREYKNAIKRFLAILLGSCSSLTLLLQVKCHFNSSMLYVYHEYGSSVCLTKLGLAEVLYKYKYVCLLTLNGHRSHGDPLFKQLNMVNIVDQLHLQELQCY